MIKDLLAKEREALNYFFDKLDISAIEKLVGILKDAKGLIILSGVGKSGLVAEKIALTLTSTGTRAFFLSPVNAFHGDLGIVSQDDIFIMLSKSGESDELLQMIPFLRNKGVKLISIVNKDNSRLGKASDFSITLPLEKELCPFDLVPTTSMVTHMLIGDVLAVALMGLKNFSLLDYAKNHPGGKIGRRLTLHVDDLMLKGNDVPLCSPKDILVDTLVELSNKRCGCLLVVDDKKKLHGIFTDGDLRRALLKYGPKALEKHVDEVMTKSPRTIKSDDMAEQALRVMEGGQKNSVAVLPVIDSQNAVVGLIKMHDLVQSGF